MTYKSTASPAYAHERLLKAIVKSVTDPDPDLRRRAQAKAQAWGSIVTGMTSGKLTIGSRTPVAKTPAWVTLEVSSEGFATGAFAAGGEITVAERNLASRFHLNVGPNKLRGELNSRLLTDEGLSHLNHALETGCYSVKLPEEAALLTFAWLLQHDHQIAALELLAQIMPFFNRLRFFPEFIDRAAPNSATVHQMTTGELIQILERMTREATSDMQNTIFTWHPLRDKLVELWLCTVKDGWPCALFPADWTERCEAWLAEYDKAVVEKRNQLKTSAKKYYWEDYKHSTWEYSRKPGRTSNFSILCDALRRCKIDSSDITGRDVGIIRKALNDTVARWGAPGSARLLDLRSQQRTQGLIPTRADITKAMIERLSKLRSDIGIEDLECAARPIVVGKGKHVVEIPECILRKLNRAAEATIDRLRELGLIPSAEVLASLVSQQTSRVAAKRFKSADLQTLYKQTYRAFSSRRSLLLLNLEHQVTLEELPWVAALSTLRSTDGAMGKEAHAMLSNLAISYMMNFPHEMIPNKFVRELNVLAKEAVPDMRLIYELADDIFMFSFNTKWRHAAYDTGQLLNGKLYARYYALPDDNTWRSAKRADDETTSVPQIAEDFLKVCKIRAEEASTNVSRGIEQNRAIIEQSHILTTHNLASLVRHLGLESALIEKGGELANRCFAWIIAQHNHEITCEYSRNSMVRNTAYAWRQAIFFLSFVNECQQRACIAKLREDVGKRPLEFRKRFAPVVEGLVDIFNGAHFNTEGHSKHGRRFIRSCSKPHWLIEDATREYYITQRA